MSDTPKFEVIDRRKLKAQEEQGAEQSPQQETPSVSPAEPAGTGPRLVPEKPHEKTDAAAPQGHSVAHEEQEHDLPAPPTAQETKEQKAAYEASAQRIEDIARAQNPAMGAPPPLSFEHLIQQFYVSALIQMGAGAQEGQRPQVDILGARSTIDLLGILAEKTRGNLTPGEDRMLQSVLYELRMMFLEITGMITMPNVQQPPPTKRK